MMDAKTNAALVAHVRKLMWLAEHCEDEDRRLDAIRSLAGFVLLIEEATPPDPGHEADDDEPEVVDLSAYRERMAA